MRGYFIPAVVFLFAAGNLYPEKGKVDSTEEKDALNVTVKADGTLLIAGKEYDHEGIKETLKALKERPDAKDPADPRFVKTSLAITADGATHFQHVQWLMMAAVRFGTIQRVILKDPIDNNRRYTVPFPKDRGLNAVPAPAEIQETRIQLRTGEKDLTTLSIEKIKIGDFQSTGDKKGPEAARAREENGKIGTAVADNVKELIEVQSTMPVIIDAGEDVRWEHVLKIVEVLSPLDAKIEFAGNPKFKDLYR